MKPKMKQYEQFIQLFVKLIPIILSIILVLHAVLSYRNDTVELSVNERVDEMTTKASLNAQSIQERYQFRLNILDVFAKHCIENKDQVNYTLDLISHMQLFNYVGILDQNGQGYDNEQRKIDARNRNYFQEAIQGRKVITDVLDSAAYKNDQVQIMAVPIFDETKEVVGVVYGTMNAESIKSSLHNISGEMMHTFMLDSNGVPLSELQNESWLNDADNIWDYFTQCNFEFGNMETIEKDIKAGRSGYYAVDFNGEKRITYYTPLKINQCYLFTNLEISDVQADLASLEARSNYQLFELGIAVSIIFFTLLRYAFDYMKRLEMDYKNALSTQAILKIVSEDNKFYIFEYNVKTKHVEKKTGLDFELFLNHEFNYNALSTNEDIERLNEALDALLTQPQVEVALGVKVQGHHRFINLRFKNIYDKHKQLVNTIGYIEDITNLKYEEQQKEDFRYKAEIDGLTGLYNASAAYEKIDLQLNQSNCMYQVLCLMDLDNFKSVNDTLGHSVGNQVLVDLAQVLKSSFRSSDLLARIGGDEFLIYFETNDLSMIDHKFHQLVLKCRKTYEENNQAVTVSASFGLAYKPKDGDSLEVLFKKADAALYQVKRESKCGYRLYKEEEGKNE